MAGGGERTPRAALLDVERVAAGLGVAGQALAEDVGNGWQAVICLICGDVVDVGRVGQLGRLVGDVARQRVGVVNAGKGLA